MRQTNQTWPAPRWATLAELLRTAGWQDINETLLTIEVEHPNFEDWWEPFTFGIGRAGSHVARLGSAQRDRLRDSRARCSRRRRSSTPRGRGPRVAT